MKVKKFNIFLNENLNVEEQFKNEHEIRTLLEKNSEFISGNAFYGLVDIMFDIWREKYKGISYDVFLCVVKEKYGLIPYFSMFLGSYNGQVCNGGHVQYFDNGYASSKSSGFGSQYDNIDVHENFIKLFKELDMSEILTNGENAYDIISDFDLDLSNPIEKCSNCNGRGVIDCEECDGTGYVDCEECDGTGDINGDDCDNCGGSGEFTCSYCSGDSTYDCSECGGSGEYVDESRMEPDTNNWSKLDNRWYDINEELIFSFNEYLKRLTLDDEKISTLLELASSTNKYNL